MPPLKDRTGERNGRLTILYRAPDKIYPSRRMVVWHCKCDCGNEVDVISSNLKRTHSCGCLNKDLFRGKDITNQRFGKLIALKPTNKRQGKNQVIWKCKCDCGSITYVTTGHLISGHTTSCGCSNSKGELKISQFLQKLNIDFEYQKTFDQCLNPKTNAKLKFDFYLPNYNCCIEYDGIQHFEYVQYFENKDSFKERSFRDSLKNEYCKNNNIKLIRIPYTDFNLIDEEFLLEKINGKRK